MTILSRASNFAKALLMLVVGMLNVIWGEKLAVNGGFGWDGALYAAWAKDFYTSIFVQKVPEYYVQRIVPSAIVHYALRLFSIPLSNHAVILGFELYNLALILISVWIWCLIADKLQISPRGKWLGILLLFVNYAMLKSNYYQPVLTDTSAFALGLALFYFFLTNRQVAFMLTFIMAAFTWPLLAYQGLLLYILPYRPVVRGPQSLIEGLPKSRINLVVAGLMCFMLSLAYIVFFTHFDRVALKFGSISGIDRSPFRLGVSVLGALAYLLFGIAIAVGAVSLFDVRAILKAIHVRRMAFGASVLLAATLVAQLLSNGEAGPLTMTSFAEYTVVVSVMKPLLFLVAHVVYFGPAVLLVLLFWKPFCRCVEEFGPGSKLLVFTSLLLSINPQSRFLLGVFPIFIVILIRVLDRLRLHPYEYMAFTLLSLFYSKVWYKMNTAPMAFTYDRRELLEFPLQHLFMNSGPWMSEAMYRVQGAVVAATALLLYVWLFRKEGRERLARARDADTGWRGEGPKMEAST